MNGSSTFDIKYKTAWKNLQQATWTVTAAAGAPWSSYTSDKISVIPSSGTKLQILLPNESVDPGSDSGKKNSATARTAGQVFNVTVNAVDDYWNIQQSSNPVVKLTANTTYYSVQSPKGLINGTTIFWVIMKDAERDPWRITVSTNDGSRLYSNISSTVGVTASSAKKLFVLAPGEGWNLAASGERRGRSAGRRLAASG